LALSLFLVVGACGDDAAVVFDTIVEEATTAITQLDPFDAAVAVVLELPTDDVFVLLDSLGDEDYFALIDRVGVAGDVEFVEALDYEKAVDLVVVLDAGLYGELVARFESGLDPTAGSPVTTLATSAESPSLPNAVADVRRLDGGPLGRRGRILVEIGPGDLSLLAFARTGNPDAQVFVTGVISPSGVDVGDAIGIEYGEFSNFGEAAVYLPMKEQVDLEIGEYEVAFEATDDIGASGVLVRSGTADGPQALDVIFWMATNEEYDTQALEQRFRSTGEAVLGAHGIAIGTMTFIDPPADIINRYSVLQFSEGGTDADLRGLCRAMSTSVGDVRALNFAIVDRLDGDEPDAIIEGSSAGLPGTAMLAGSDLSCVAGMASPDPDDPGRDLFDRAVVVWHEAGHLLGLYHTSESDGQYFDLFDDTPECRSEERDTDDDGFVDLYECDGFDADNFMFHDGDGATMTDDQAWMVRRHPLLYPAQG
jgi:hypothetical protein